jgi:ankyrin repeat protein
MIGFYNPSVIHSAVLAQDIPLIHRLVHLGYDIDTVDSGGNTAIFCAIFEPHILRTLCEEGAKVNFFEDESIIRHLIKSHCEDYPICMESLKVLLKYGATLSGSLHAVTCSPSLVPLIKVLLDAGADIEEVWNDMTPLVLAISMNNPEAVQVLVDAGANVNGAGIPSPLFATIELVRSHLDYGHTSVILEILSKAGADMKKVDDNRSVLSYALTMSDGNMPPDTVPFVVETLCKYGADVNFRHDIVPNYAEHAGDTPLHFAARVNMEIPKENNVVSRECMGILISYGAIVDLQNNAGRTPLHTAVASSDLYFVQDLVQNGARTDLKDNDGDTALTLAQKMDVRKEVITFLAEQQRKDCKLIRVTLASFNNAVIVNLFSRILLHIPLGVEQVIVDSNVLANLKGQGGFVLEHEIRLFYLNKELSQLQHEP